MCMSILYMMLIKAVFNEFLGGEHTINCTSRALLEDARSYPCCP